MAEKPKEKKHSHHSGGEMNFGVEVLLFVIGIFIIWLIAGGAKKPTTGEKPFIPQPEVQVSPKIN